MKIKSLIISIIILLPNLSIAQPAYQVGTSKSSIEPDQSLISLHLGGYGSPKAGRFTLQWVNKESLQEVSLMTGSGNKIFILSKGILLCKDPESGNSSWKEIGKTGNVKAIAVLNENLYAVDNEGSLLVSKLEGGIKWKKIGSVDNSVTVLTSSGNNLFAANNSGLMWSADMAGKSIDWTKIQSVEDIISLTSKDGRIYALNNEGVIYQYESWNKYHKWLKVAYRNGQTIKEDIKHISIVHNRIYGIDNENKLYIGEHRTEGTLTARAMAIKGGDKTVVLVSVDVCGLNDTFTGLVKQEIYKELNIPVSAVFINSIHTHFAPVSQNWLPWQEPNQRPDSVYLYSTIRTGIVNAVRNAVKNISPAEMQFGRGTTDIGYNRSLNEHQEIYDSAVDVIKVKFLKDNSEDYLFMAACHPVFSTAGTLHYTISPNYPGIARKLVEERTNTLNSLFLQGTCGDINPRDNGEYITGEKLANEVIAVLNRPMTKIEGEISYFLDTINIPTTPWKKEDILAFRDKNIIKPGDVDAEKNVKWCDLMLRYYDEGTMPKFMPIYVHTINIGNWKLVGFSRETTTGYGLGVKNMWPDKLISVAGYTNDVSSYLPTHMHIENKTYEGNNSFFWYGMPNVFPENVDDIILDRIKSLHR
ncbi:MAG: hypothetical protein LLG13_03415 [Bacteroidales bacterium]|nr:hypothetical protein [Bacteroidales bacterium]